MHAVEHIFAGSRRVQAAENVHRRRFAVVAAGAHDGDELALMDGKINAAQRLKFSRPLTVSFGDAGQRDERAFSAG